MMENEKEFVKDLARQKVAKRYRALGTVIDLVIYGTKDERLLDQSFQLIQHYEDIFTVNRENSDLMQVNQAAGKMAVQVPDPVYQLSKIAIAQSQQHFGFNAAIGPLVKLWRIGFSDARLPKQEEIAEKMNLISPDQIVLNDQNLSIYLPEAGMELDLGAIAKGYIADRVRDFWQAYGISSGIINLGGNLIVIGPAPHQPNQKWRVGIRNPLDSHDKQSIAQLQTSSSSVVTSGISERHFELDGKSYHHIIDPETGYPHETNIASVTVLSEQSIDGEIETTKLFFAKEIPQNYPYSAIIVYLDKSIRLVNFDRKNLHLINNDFYLSV